jgi:hypothetical protein
MSVGVFVASEGGIATAVDSRRTVQAGSGGPFAVESDQARKLFLPQPGIVVATHGKAVIGGKTIGALMEEFAVLDAAGGVIDFAKSLGEWFGGRMREATDSRRGDFVKADALQWPLGFAVAGFNDGVGHIYAVKVRAGDSQVEVEAPSTANPGIYPFGLTDGIDRLLKGIDRDALRQAKVKVSPVDQPKLELLSYDLAVPKELAGALDLAQALVQVQFLSQEISFGTFASAEVRVKGCGGQIRTAIISRAGAEFGPSVNLQGLTVFPEQNDAVPAPARRNA